MTRPGVKRPNVESAQQLFERALALDPGFAEAHAALSEVHGRMYWWRYDPSPARVEHQQKEAEAAMRLGPDLPQSHAAMGLVHYWGHRDYQRAIAEFRIALKGMPSDAQLWGWITSVNLRWGKWDEAVTAFETATQFDPRNANLFSIQGVTSYAIAGRFPEALRNADRALRLAPDLFGAAASRGWIYASWQGQLDTIRAVLGRLSPNAELGPNGTMASQKLRLFHWERQPDSMLGLLRSSRTTVYEGQGFFQPASLYAASAHQLRGEGVAAPKRFAKPAGCGNPQRTVRTRWPDPKSPRIPPGSWRKVGSPMPPSTNSSAYCPHPRLRVSTPSALIRCGTRSASNHVSKPCC